MPTSLAIDTSTPTGRLAVATGATIVFAAEFGTERSHNSEIFAPLGAALDACAGAPERIVVGTGPGSYTGVRIGIAASIGISLAKGVPAAGIPSICCPSAAGPDDQFTMVGDARRGSIYCAKVAGRQLIEAPALHPAESFATPEGELFTYDPTPPVEGAVATAPSAAKLAVLAAAMSESDFAALAATPPEPIYLRAPFITQPKKPGKAVPSERT